MLIFQTYEKLRFFNNCFSQIHKQSANSFRIFEWNRMDLQRFIIVDVQSSISPLQYAETISRELRRLIEKSKKKKRKNDRAFSFLLIPSEPLGW